MLSRVPEPVGAPQSRGLWRPDRPAMLLLFLSMILPGIALPGIVLPGIALPGIAKPTESASPRILQAADLGRESRAAIAEGRVYLLYVSRPECPYCARLEEQVLLPMLKSGSYEGWLVLRELSWEGSTVIDFSGKKRVPEDLIREYGVTGTPTLLFLDAKGRELTGRLVGYYSEDFYWHYFEKAAESAHDRLQAR